jgi:hypothetical protein
MQPGTAGLYPCHGAGVQMTKTLYRGADHVTPDQGESPCFRNLVQVGGESDAGGHWFVWRCTGCVEAGNPIGERSPDD